MNPQRKSHSRIVRNLLRQAGLPNSVLQLTYIGRMYIFVNHSDLNVWRGTDVEKNVNALINDGCIVAEVHTGGVFFSLPQE